MIIEVVLIKVNIGKVLFWYEIDISIYFIINILMDSVKLKEVIYDKNNVY